MYKYGVLMYPSSNSTVQSTKAAPSPSIVLARTPILAAARDPSALLQQSFYHTWDSLKVSLVPNTVLNSASSIQDLYSQSTRTPYGQHKWYLAQATTISIRLNVQNPSTSEDNTRPIGDPRPDRVTPSHPSAARRVILILQSHAQTQVPALPPSFRQVLVLGGRREGDAAQSLARVCTSY